MIVNLVIISPTGKTETQSINMLLSEPNGRWFSDCSGDICLIKYPLTTFSNYSFKEKGVYTFKIIQDMRENPIEHIMSVGLRIEKANEVLN